MKKLRTLLITLLVGCSILLVAGILLIPTRVETLWQQLGLPPAPLTQVNQWLGRTPEQQGIQLYGTLEARTLLVMSEINGQAIEVLVDEGDTVVTGQPLIHLQPDTVQAQVAAARQSVVAAQAARDAVAAGPDENQQALAEQTIAAAQTQVSNAQRQLQQMQSMLAHPQSIESQIAQTTALIAVAKAGAEAAQVSIRQVENLIVEAQKDGSREGKYKLNILQEQKAAAQANQQGAQARVETLYRTLALLRAMQKQPLTLEAQVHQAEGQLSVAQAALVTARAQADAQLAPPRPEVIAVAQAQVQKAQAALALAQWQEQRLTITAPAAGQVQEKMLSAGELAQVGRPLLSLAQTDPIELWVYVPQQVLHRIHLGQRLPVAVLALPRKPVTGEVFFIAAQAQFRPNNVLNPDDRGDMVFLVKLSLPNAKGLLKPGMPADVLLGD
jgi:HlyD family secretion protein